MGRYFIDYNKNLKTYSRSHRNHATLGEVILWKRLKGRQLMGLQFNRQKPIDNFIVDFYCKKLHLAVEVDGSSHIGKEEYDKKRDVILSQAGLTVLHINDDDVRSDIDGVVKQIECFIKEEVSKRSHH